MPPADLPLADWTLQIRHGDRAAFEALFRALRPMLLRLARTLGQDADAAEDTVQEAFVRLWEGRARLDPAQSVRAYLAQAVRNRVFSATRDARTRAALLEAHAASETVSAADRPDDVAHGAALADRLQAFLADLPDRQREALALTRFEGLSHAAAADAMGCSVRTVNNHIVRGLQTLRDRLRAIDSDDPAR